jgi:outer membrane receptor protein involved in Fe transport
MFKKVLFVLLISILSVANAGTVGKIVGLVTDKKTGEPLPGVNVILEGTYLGATTDINGYYSILNVAVGSYDVKVSYVGFREMTIKGVKVHVDLTTTVSAQLEPTVMELDDAITVVAERPIIKKDETNTVVIKTSEEIKEMAVRGVQSIASLQAGVVKEENSGVLNIRGGRGNETSYIVDGVVQNNPLRGGMAASVNNNSIEEIQLQTGGFNAEYGRIMSGMVHITTKTGGRDYRFLLEGITDAFTNDAIGAESYGYNDYNATVSGPVIPGDNLATFYLSAQRQYYEDRNPSWIQRSWNEKYTDGDVVKDNNDLGRWNFNGKFLFQPLSDLKIILSGLYTSNDYNTYFHTYSLGNEAHNTHQEDWTTSWNMTVNYTLGSKSFMDVKLSYFDHEYKSGDGVFFEDLEKYGSKAHNPLIDDWGRVTTTRVFPDFYEIDHVNNLFTKERTSYIGGSFDIVHQLNKTNTLKFGFNYEYHTLRFYETRPAAWWQNAREGVVVDADENPVSVIGADVPDKDYGFWVTRHRALSHTYNFGYDVWGNETDEDLFGRADLDDYFSDKLSDNAKRPIMMSAYLQDKIEFEDLVLNLGLRMDYLNSNDWVFKDLSSPFGEDKVFDKDDIEESEAHMFFMPRLGFAFPVNATTKFHAQYGVFYQMPNLIDLYNGRMYLENLMLDQPWYDSIGNPNLEPEKTTSYEVGFAKQIGDNLGVNVNVFYKETEGLIQQVSFVNDITSLGTYVNGDFGSVKGVDFMLNLRRTNNVSASFNYTLSYAKGTGSASGTLRNIAWLQGEIPTVTSSLDFDQRHTGSLSIDYRLSGDDGPILMGIRPFANSGVNLIGTFNSGRPYTLRRLTGNEPYAGGGTSRAPLTGVNAVFSEWNYRLDMKIDKSFEIPYVGLRANAFIWVLNLLDTENIRSVWTTTGKPDNNGYADSEAGKLALASKIAEGDTDVANRYYYRGLHPSNWGVPRMVRFGLRIEL